MNTTVTQRVGIVGTGAMGRPVVDRLLAAGYDVAAYVRRPEPRAELSAAGVAVVDDVRALGADRDVVILYVYTDQQVRELALADGLVDAMAPGSLLVIHTTGSPDTARAIAEHAAVKGVAVVDAPGSGGPAQVAAGTLVLFVGGADSDVARCRTLVASYAAEAVHFGPVGAGQKVKLINNLLFGAHIQLALDAARLSAHFGIEVGQLATTLHNCSGASAALDLVAAMGSAEALLSAAGPFVYKDVLVAREVAAELGASLGTIESVTTPLLEATRPS